MIARQQQMIAIVDHHVERAVEIGAAAATAEWGGFVECDGTAGVGQGKRRGQAS